LVAPGAISSTPPTQLTTTFHFDEFSRLKQLDYPGTSGFAVEYGFDSAGNVISAADPTHSSVVYWRISDVDQGYRLKRETLGNGVTTDRHYDASSGHLDSITTMHGSASVQHLTYGYTKNNLTRRTNVTSGVTETFGYDALNRVNRTTYSNHPVWEEVTYDPVSNAISRKDPVGDYSYQAQGRDWIKSAGGTDYTQDPFGNVQTRSGPYVPGGMQEYAYTTFNLPSHVSLGSGPTLNVDFAYDADGTRVVKQTDTETTYYAGDLYQLTTSASGTSQRFMVYAGGRTVAAVTQASSSEPLIVSYLHDDALGSVESITAADGSFVGSRRFDTFGDLQSSTATFAQAPYGYTGQEQDLELGLVNMHGRMYDPRLGQFMSPDPEIQSPYGQGLNRFAYVFNSPMNYTDPSGFTATESYWEAGLGLGVPFTAGLVATIWQSSAGGEMALDVGAKAIETAPGVAGTATSALDTAQAIGAGVHAVTSVVNTAVKAGNQTKTQTTSKAPSTRAAAARSVAQGDTKHSAVSAKRERPRAPTPTEPPAAPKSEPACDADCRNASPAGLAPPVNHIILNQAAPLVDDSGEFWDDKGGWVLEIATTVFTPAKILGLGAKAVRGAQIHHIATNKAIKSGFTAAFERIFAKAGMKLDDVANKVLLPGHAGRHAPAYHQYVLGRLQQATHGLTGPQAAAALRAELNALAKELLANPSMVKGIGLP
jgi:RHS repeat-associated protein